MPAEELWKKNISEKKLRGPWRQRAQKHCNVALCLRIFPLFGKKWWCETKEKMFAMSQVLWLDSMLMHRALIFQVLIQLHRKTGYLVVLTKVKIGWYTFYQHEWSTRKNQLLSLSCNYQIMQLKNTHFSPASFFSSSWLSLFLTLFTCTRARMCPHFARQKVGVLFLQKKKRGEKCQSATYIHHARLGHGGEYFHGWELPLHKGKGKFMSGGAREKEEELYVRVSIVVTPNMVNVKPYRVLFGITWEKERMYKNCSRAIDLKEFSE